MATIFQKSRLERDSIDITQRLQRVRNTFPVTNYNTEVIPVNFSYNKTRVIPVNFNYSRKYW